ncbi:type I-C CRISPR-associated endonuclease Cas1c [Desulfatitalea alkaliphila]|uniref:CRISPR-associated endonuclease Cas1 n=1 Tax=Desulfatitalea alkaliphila TaxID=2929485 RepID=A0AA41R7P6_9BACT|nr:type I-C CRISPR-associated endonuclease Cas1c [Desulfatitalea alkaliphila]
MKKHLNTLFVTTQGAYLNKEGETVKVSVEGEKRIQLPLHTLDNIVCFGRVTCSPFLMGFCAENNVGLSFLTNNGRFLARVQGPVSGNVLLRREQYRRADDPASSGAMAGFFLTGKIANTRTVMQRALRDHGDKIPSDTIQKAIALLAGALKRLPDVDNLDTLRGIEGDTARCYFSVFDHLIVHQKIAFAFNGRNRRPPRDNVNCLLSFLYTLMLNDIRSALECVGLDPAVGFLHRDRPGRPGLALDMMEEFRPFLADRLALTLINLGQVEAKGFHTSETGAVTMSASTRKAIILSYQKRKQDTIMHPFIKEKVAVGALFHIQALLLARCLRGDLDGYPPFVWR